MGPVLVAVPIDDPVWTDCFRPDPRNFSGSSLPGVFGGAIRAAELIEASSALESDLSAA